MKNSKFAIQTIGILFWLVYVFFGLDLIFNSKNSVQDIQFKFVSTLAVFVLASYISWLFVNPKAGILLLQFWIFNSIFFILAPIAVISYPSSWFVNSSLDQGSKIRAFYFVLGALLIAFIGSESSIKLVSKQNFNYRIDAKRFKSLFTIYVVLFLTLLVFRWRFIDNALVDYSSGQYFSPVSPMESGLMRAFLVAVPMIFVLCIIKLENQISYFAKRMFLSLLLIILLIFASPLGNSRQTFLLAFLPIIFACLSENLVLRRLVTFIIFLVTVFGQPFSYAITHSAGKFRTEGLSGVFQSFNVKPSQILTSGDFDSFGMFATGLDHLAWQSFEVPFSQFFGVFFYWIPRSLWSGKPQDTAVEIATLAGFSFQNLSAPWLLELLANGGFVLIIVGAFLVPRLFKKLDQVSTTQDFQWLLTYLLIGTEFILLRGSLLQASGVVIFGLVLSRLLVKRVE